MKTLHAFNFTVIEKIHGISPNQMDVGKPSLHTLLSLSLTSLSQLNNRKLKPLNRTRLL